MIELPRGGDGKRRRMLRRARTKAEAQALLRMMRDELAATGIVSSGRRTLGDAVAAYRDRRPDSEQDRWATGLIVEGLGAVRLADLTVRHCDQFLDAASLGLGNRRSIGKEQLGKLRRCLIAVIRNDMRIGYVPRNVAELSSLPPLDDEARDRRALSLAELRALINNARGSRLIIVDFCGRNGLRPAEARAVRWQDVDLDGAELRVTGQMNRRNVRAEVKKAHNASRTIALDQATVGRLKVWREDQSDMRAVAGSAWCDLDFVASTSQGTPIDRHSLARSMRSLCRRTLIEPPVTPYELRHTAISMQADAGRSSWDIADWAGTSEAMVNRVYRHRLRRVARVRPVDSESDVLGPG